MTVTINFKKMEGPKQIVSITLRIDTTDFVDAVVQAVNQILTMTTIEVESVHVNL